MSRLIITLLLLVAFALPGAGVVDRDELTAPVAGADEREDPPVEVTAAGGDVSSVVGPTSSTTSDPRPAPPTDQGVGTQAVTVVAPGGPAPAVRPPQRMASPSHHPGVPPRGPPALAA